MTAAAVRRKHVVVFPGPRYDSEKRLLASLASLYPVQFFREGEIGPERMDGALFFPEAWALSEHVFERGVASFRFAVSRRGLSLASEESVNFTNHPALHVAFRNAGVKLGGDTRVAELVVRDLDTDLAVCGSARFWQVRAGHGAELHTTAVAPPELPDKQLLWSCLVPGNWAALFPLLHFLRRLTADCDWLPGPQCASFVFDDPNLHSVRYGYLDFVELVRESRAHNYHVACATVPLDALYAAPKAVQLFRANAERLSLLIHGNNHVRNEFAQERSPEEGLTLLAQALRRVERLERRTGLSVARVIAPPHGWWSESMMAQALRLPIEGVCTSGGGALAPAPDGPALGLDFGLSPTSFMPSGCPVARRWDLSYGLAPLRFSAFLGQPLIPYGHHRDCAGGLQQLAHLADAMNSWGPVNWTNLESMLRCQYRMRFDGELMHIEMRSRRVRVKIPPGVSWVAVHAPCGLDGDAFTIGVFQRSAVPEPFQWGVPIPVRPSASFELEVRSGPVLDPCKVRRPRYHVWAPVRRAFAIGRDRLLPLRHGVYSAKRSASPLARAEPLHPASRAN